jgi:hypothetical protein
MKFVASLRGFALGILMAAASLATAVTAGGGFGRFGGRDRFGGGWFGGFRGGRR